MLDLFGDEIISSKIIDRDVLTSILMESIYGINEQELVSMMYSKYEAIIDFSRLCSGKKTGEKISMIFTPHRYSTPTKKSISIVEAFKKESFISGIARATLFKEGKVKELLYQVLQLGINGIQYVNEFPPIIARDFYMQYQAMNILDPCAGYGAGE